MAHLFGFGHGSKGGGGLEWDEILIALFSLLTWFRGGQSHTATDSDDKDGKQKIVSILQAFVSKVDEGIWLSLITQLNKKQKGALTRLLGFFERFREKDSFRLTVINAPIATTTIEDQDPKDEKKKIKRIVKVGEYSNRDTRVVFLKEIAQLVDDPAWGPEKVRDMLRAHELATENKVAENALKFWNGTLVWMNERVCEFFEVESLDKITFAKVVEVLNIRADQVAGYVNTLAEKVTDRPVADMNLGFWRHTFRHHRVQACFLIVGIILTIAFFAFVSPN